MKFKRLILLWAVLLCSLAPLVRVQAQNVGPDYYEAFIEVNGSLTDYIQYQFKQNNVLLTGRYDGFVTARVNPNTTEAQILAIDNVTKVTRAVILETCSDSARYYSRVEPVLAGEGFDMPYDGKDVIIGIIDCGFDYNHINLCDSNGLTRVKAVYMPLDTTGTPPVIRAVRMPGSCYESSAQISALTTDDPNTPHGTQVAGIAAGSYTGNNWHGIAPGADLVLCGIPENQLTDTRVANCVSYICDYATRKHKPCVINISHSTNVGPHDGTSYLNRVFSQFAGPGRIFVVSAGNDGDIPVHLTADIATKQDTITALISASTLERKGLVSAWSLKDKPFNTRFVIVDTYSGQIVYRSSAVGATAAGVTLQLSTEQDEALAQYCTGTASLAGAIQVNQRPASVCQLDLTLNSRRYALGFIYYTPLATSLSVWTSGQNSFSNFSLPWVSTGTTAGSINDLAATDSVISVGSYNTRQYVPLRDGTTYFRYLSTPMELSYYSSYGPDDNGIPRPDVCAPGSVIIASANRYDVNPPNIEYWQPSAWVDGVEYTYCPDLGTSMSAPVVSGAVALMLQVNPDLGNADIRDILSHTCYKDAGVKPGQAAKWGYGKLDVNAAMRYLLHIEDKSNDVNGDGEVNISDVNTVISIILGGHADADTTRRADVNGDGEVNISDVNTIIDDILS